MGELAGVGGFRLGGDCLLVLSGTCNVIVEGLKGFGVAAGKLETYVRGDRVKALFG